MWVVEIYRDDFLGDRVSASMIHPARAAKTVSRLMMMAAWVTGASFWANA